MEIKKKFNIEQYLKNKNKLFIVYEIIWNDFEIAFSSVIYETVHLLNFIVYTCQKTEHQASTSFFLIIIFTFYVLENKDMFDY